MSRPGTALQRLLRLACLRSELASPWARRSATTIVADGATATGTATGTAARSYTEATPTMEILPGAAATTAPVPPLMDRTGLRAVVVPTIRATGPMPVAHLP